MDQITFYSNDDINLKVRNFEIDINSENIEKPDDIINSFIPNHEEIMEVQQTDTHNESNSNKYVNKNAESNTDNIRNQSAEGNPESFELVTDDNCKTSIIQNEKTHHYINCDWKKLQLICNARKEFKPTESSENFTKGCFWSPDGTCLLVPSEDFKIYIFELPTFLYSGNLPENFKLTELESVLRIKEGGTVYDTCWFPFMNSWSPDTCCFLSTSQGSPIHLWDAFNGQLRATYRAYNLVDEVEAAISIQFTNYGSQIWSGFKNSLKIFDAARPGRQTETIYLKKDFPNVSGLVSCIRENPSMPGLIAFGTYSKNIGLYKDGPLCSFKTSSGVTQIEFSPCGTKLYSAVRRNNEFLCWDLRNPGMVLYSLQERKSDTNQRIHFCQSDDGEIIVSGGTDGSIKIWKIPYQIQCDDDIDPFINIKISKDCINGVNLHKSLPILAVSSGKRICDEIESLHRDNSIRLYWLDR